MDSIIRLVRREPVRAYAGLVAALAVAVSFGLDLTAEQQGAILGFAAIVLGTGETVRSRVSPVDRD